MYSFISLTQVGWFDLIWLTWTWDKYLNHILLYGYSKKDLFALFVYMSIKYWLEQTQRYRIHSILYNFIQLSSERRSLYIIIYTHSTVFALLRHRLRIYIQEPRTHKKSKFLKENFVLVEKNWNNIGKPKQIKKILFQTNGTWW